ncbi:hypothetical protein EJ06DRAFT_553405 [Trichodelitschia bisporula]|uniref:Maintenance of telomere capping protein 1 n=1 Tax=Trichodelitschia bisporula TaxID=703511 RepID=A0A6G1I933_9PEZI|nr:hypothetical protein EJ06DRAFT_553405 [Trichodelitschia bisporula]
MAQKKALTDEELLAQLEIGTGGAPSKSSINKAARAPAGKSASGHNNDDPLADLASLESLAKSKPVSRPNTPKLTAGRTSREMATPTSSARTSEDKQRPAPRKSGESARSFHQALTPASEDEDESSEEEDDDDEEEEEEEEQPAVKEKPPPKEQPKPQSAPEPQPAQQQSGGWWGGIFATATATASAAVKQAEAAVKEIQKNEEALKWAEQVRGNVGALRGLGDELRSRAIPTFTNILHTIAPPISQHERLQIHTTHDFAGYPSLDRTVYTTFSRVMAQVEGGDLLVLQRGSESTARRNSTGAAPASTSAWSDGPWWRDARSRRNLSIVDGLNEGTKLARAAAESHAAELYAAHGGLEAATRAAGQLASETNPVRSSDIFLALQAVGYIVRDDELFAGSAADATPTEGGVQAEAAHDALVAFAIYLHDPVHGINFGAVTQGVPRRWCEWMDAGGSDGEELGIGEVPAEIREIVGSGGVDPREWVAEWLEDVISLGVGIVAQRYVARRMGVGEGGIGRGKGRAEVLEAGAGEMARAI